MKKAKPESILGKQGPQIRTRSFVLFSIVSLIAVMLIGRLFYLQIINYKKYRAAVIEQMIYETPISASRGLITDRNGVVLATNYTVIFLSFFIYLNFFSTVQHGDQVIHTRIHNFFSRCCVAM